MDPHHVLVTRRDILFISGSYYAIIPLITGWGVLLRDYIGDSYSGYQGDARGLDPKP